MALIKAIPLIFLINLLSVSTCFGQSTKETSNNFWTGLSLKYELNKKIAFSLEEQTRVSDNFNSIESIFLEPGAKYEFNKFFSTKLQYRYIVRNDQRNVNRISLDANAKFRIKPVKLEFGYRARYQHAIVVYTKEPITFIRNKLEMKCKFSKKIKAFGAYELFYKLNEKNEFRKNRYTVGLDLSVNKQIDLSVYYRFDQEVNKKNPSRENIVALLLSIDI